MLGITLYDMSTRRSTTASSINSILRVKTSRFACRMRFFVRAPIHSSNVWNSPRRGAPSKSGSTSHMMRILRRTASGKKYPVRRPA